MSSTARHCPIFLRCHGSPPKDAGRASPAVRDPCLTAGRPNNGTRHAASRAHHNTHNDLFSASSVTKSCPPIFRFASGRRGLVTAAMKFKLGHYDGGRAENACLLKSRCSEERFETVEFERCESQCRSRWAAVSPKRYSCPREFTCRSPHRKEVSSDPNRGTEE